MLTTRRMMILGCLLGGWLCLMGFLHQLLLGLPDIEKLQNYTPPLVTKIFDIHGALIGELFIERRSLLPLSDIPKNLQHAFLATEDENFYKHWGINLQSILRAAIANLRHGRVVEGGSSITQQLSKVIFFSQEKTIMRKLRELLLAVQLERNYSKDEILQFYLNQIYLGHGAYGVQSAARVYFGKEIRDLTLADCAMLAGLTRSPRNYSPFLFPASAQRRRDWVLSRMHKCDFITSDQLKEASKVPLLSKRDELNAPVGAYFIEYVRLLLEPKYGGSTIYQGGLSVYTTLDLKMQRAAEAVMEKALAGFDADHQKELLKAMPKPKKGMPAPVVSTTTVKVQGAILALDPLTGGVRAMVGGRNFQESQFNRATQAQRQPGSAFKPFVWAAAIDEDMTPATIVDDDRVGFMNDGRDWSLIDSATDAASIQAAIAPFPQDQVWVPKNWDNKYFGPVTLRRGLALSRNLVSIRIANHIGAAKVVATAQKAGIQSKMNPILSIALGTEQTNLMELTGSYATFANGGIHPEPFSILRVEDKNGRVLEEHSPRLEVGLSAQTAYVMVELMRAVISEGTAHRALSLNRPVAGKTGTNQDLRDLWFVGFTPELVTGAWMGYDDFSPLGKNFTASSKLVPWWTEFMKQALVGIPSRAFRKPDGIVFARMDSRTGYLALPTCPKVVLQAFKRGTEPKDYCPVDHQAAPVIDEGTEE